jgi:hypothetical protein
VYKDVITLFPKTKKLIVTFQDLENGLDIAGKIREPLRLINIVSCMQDIEGLINAGYKPKDAPETVSMNLAVSLGAKGITLLNIRHVNQDTEVTCVANEDFADEELLFLILQNIHEFIRAYENTFERTPSSEIKLLITKIDGKTMKISCNIDQTLSYLNTSGYSEIPFELTMNGVTGTIKLKVNVGEGPIKLG